MNKTKQITKETKIEVMEPEQQLTVQNEGQIVSFDPALDITRAKDAADMLVDIVRKNNWVQRFGGAHGKEHLMYEAWQTVAKFYHITIKTDEEVAFVEYGGVSGFEAHAVAINNDTGMVIGGAKALCMRDEPNWKNKPTFQLASMAQTRAGSKALRQLFGYVVALAGYSPTPAEEMQKEGEYLGHGVVVPTKTAKAILADDTRSLPFASPKQLDFIQKLIEKKGKTKQDLLEFISTAFQITDETKLNIDQADIVIKRLLGEPDKAELDYDEIDKALSA